MRQLFAAAACTSYAAGLVTALAHDRNAVRLHAAGGGHEGKHEARHEGGTTTYPCAG